MPTEVELEILKVLWERGESTVREVWEVMSQARKVAYTTVQTMLEVMRRKRMVAVRRRQRPRAYRPAEDRDLVARRMVTHLVNRVAEGSVPQLLSHALAGRQMLPEEITAMRCLVGEAERRMEGDRR
jgi:predicted transcriptional regulator